MFLNAAIVLRGGLLGGAFDPVRAADQEPESVRGDRRGHSPPDHRLHPQSLPSLSPRLLSNSQRHPPPNQEVGHLSYKQSKPTKTQPRKKEKRKQDCFFLFFVMWVLWLWYCYCDLGLNLFYLRFNLRVDS